MVPDALEGHPVLEALFGAAFFVGALLLAHLVQGFGARLAKRLALRTQTKLDDLLVEALKTPVAWLIIVQGAFVGLTAVTYLDKHQSAVNKAWGVVVLAVVFLGVQRVVSALITWYGHEVAVKRRTTWDEQALPIIRRVLNFVILAVGVLMILECSGVSISPMLAGLGIGGLAVALALQPTLGNFVSGTYVLSDGSIKPGDFLEIHQGPMGTVQEVGWRTTRILTTVNNMVIVPNSKLADSIVTNYSQPAPSMAVFVSCGVSYDSDLARVEQVVREEMAALQASVPAVDASVPPAFVYREFGDSNITFLAIMRGQNRAATFAIQHELVKALHARFSKEGIEINYPVRKVVFPAGAPQFGATGPGSTAYVNPLDPGDADED